MRHSHKVDLLEGVGAKRSHTHLSSNNHNGRRVHHGIGHTGQRVGGAGTRRHYSYAHFAAHPRIALGGMGGSREVYVAAFVEPVVMLAVLSNVLHTNSTSLAGMSLRTDEVNLTVAGVLTCIAFFLVLLAENSRIPVDNPDTHLELTMIHECMTLEYSGRLLALIHWASQLKLLVFLVLFAMLYLPLDLPVVFKVLISAVAVGVVETLNNKMRLFKVRVYLAAAGLMLLLAVVAQ